MSYEIDVPGSATMNRSQLERALFSTLVSVEATIDRIAEEIADPEQLQAYHDGQELRAFEAASGFDVDSPEAAVLRLRARDEDTQQLYQLPFDALSPQQQLMYLIFGDGDLGKSHTVLQTNNYIACKEVEATVSATLPGITDVTLFPENLSYTSIVRDQRVETYSVVETDTRGNPLMVKTRPVDDRSEEYGMEIEDDATAGLLLRESLVVSNQLLRAAAEMLRRETRSQP